MQQLSREMYTRLYRWARQAGKPQFYERVALRVEPGLQPETVRAVWQQAHGRNEGKPAPGAALNRLDRVARNLRAHAETVREIGYAKSRLWNARRDIELGDFGMRWAEGDALDALADLRANLDAVGAALVADGVTVDTDH